MGTHSSINIFEDGVVRGVYCNFDGYPSHQAPILLNHYASVEAVRALIAGGDMSQLEPNMSGLRTYGRRATRTDMRQYVYNYIFDIAKNAWFISVCGDSHWCRL